MYACEWNPVAAQALMHNLHRNGLAERCTVLEGDCTTQAPQVSWRQVLNNKKEAFLWESRHKAPVYLSMHRLSPCKAVQGVADRVMLGLLPSSQCAWGTALAALKDQGGWLHLHSNVKDSDEAAWSQATLVCPTHACHGCLQ